MKEQELNLRLKLGKEMGGVVRDPQYAPPHQRDRDIQALLKWMKDNDAERAHFPSWTFKYAPEKKETGEKSVDLPTESGFL